MTFLPAAVWRQIAETQELQSPAAKLSFRLNPQQLARMSSLLETGAERAGIPPKVARCLPTCLPLLTEREAISQFVSQHPEMRNALPEVNDPQEAVDLMTSEYRLTPADQATLLRLLSSPQVVNRWLKAAQEAQAEQKAA